MYISAMEDLLFIISAGVSEMRQKGCYGRGLTRMLMSFEISPPLGYKACDRVH